MLGDQRLHLGGELVVQTVQLVDVDGDSDVLFDQDVVHTFDIGLSEENQAFLDGDPAAEEYVAGSLTFDGETLEDVGVRYKGSIGAFLGCVSGDNFAQPSGEKTCTKLSMKLKINWQGADREFYGQRKIQFHALNLDDSLLRDRLFYWMFDQAGVPSPRATHARVTINGEFVGLFALVEQVDGRFTRDRFEDGKGNLYKEVWPFVQGGEVNSDENFIDALETNEDEDPTAVLSIGDRSFGAELLREDPKSRVVLSRAWALKRRAWEKIVEASEKNETVTAKVVRPSAADRVAPQADAASAVTRAMVPSRVTTARVAIDPRGVLGSESSIAANTKRWLARERVC